MISEHRKEYKKQWRKDNREHIIQYRKQHYKEHSDYYKQWQRKHPEYQKRYRQQHPIKYKAHMKINILKRSSIVWIIEDCALCDSNINIELHHENYDLPYVIIFLCNVCHKKVHRRYEK